MPKTRKPRSSQSVAAEERPGDFLPTPTKPAQKLMAAHLKKHGLTRFQVERHVHLGGPRTEEQLLTWNPANASFSCSRCPGVFVTGELTRETIRRAQLLDPKLQAQLVGLTDPAERDEMTRHYLSGDLAREQLRSMRAGGHRRAVASSRPTVDARRKRMQDWMLEAYAREGTVETVFDVTEDLRGDDPELWKKLADRPLSRAAIKGYWSDIDPARKTKAKRRFQRGQEQG